MKVWDAFYTVEDDYHVIRCLDTESLRVWTDTMFGDLARSATLGLHRYRLLMLLEEVEQSSG